MSTTPLSPLEQLAQSSQTQPSQQAAPASDLSPLDQLAQGVQTPSGSQSAPGTITGDVASIGAPEQQPTTWAGKFGKWADDVALDLQDGGDRTGLGTVLQKLGARGLHTGNSEAVGDFMGSLPLGLLQAGKGTSELTPKILGGPKGQTIQGLKDVVGGGLKAITEPAAFVAPEETGLSDEGLLSDAANAASKTASTVSNAASKTAESVSNAAQAVKGVFTNIPKQTESQLVETVGDAAEQAGLTRPEADTFQGSVGELADQFKQRAQNVYQALDDAAPGFQETRDKIAQLTKAYKTQLNLDPEKASEIEASLNQAKENMSDLLDDGQTAQWKAADQDWTRYRSLQQVLGKTAKSAEDLTNDALTNVDKLKSGFSSLSNTMKGGNPVDMLYRAFPEHAGDLSAIVQQATKLTDQSQTASKILHWLGYGAATATAGAAGAAGYRILTNK